MVHVEYWSTRYNKLIKYERKASAAKKPSAAKMKGVKTKKSASKQTKNGTVATKSKSKKSSSKRSGAKRQSSKSATPKKRATISGEERENASLEEIKKRKPASKRSAAKQSAGKRSAGKRSAGKKSAQKTSVSKTGTKGGTASKRSAAKKQPKQKSASKKAVGSRQTKSKNRSAAKMRKEARERSASKAAADKLQKAEQESETESETSRGQSSVKGAPHPVMYMSTLIVLLKRYKNDCTPVAEIVELQMSEGKPLERESIFPSWRTNCKKRRKKYAKNNAKETDDDDKDDNANDENTEIKDDSGSRTADKWPFGEREQENCQYALRVPPDFERAFRACERKPGTRFIFGMTHLRSRMGGAHRNSWVFDKNDNSVELFEPHGEVLNTDWERQSYNRTGYYAAMTDFFKKKLGVDNVHAPGEFCPVGFQSLQNVQQMTNLPVGKDDEIDDYSGSCQSWSLWWIDYRLKHAASGKSRTELVKDALQDFNKKQVDFGAFIREFNYEVRREQFKIIEQAAREKMGPSRGRQHVAKIKDAEKERMRLEFETKKLERVEQRSGKKNIEENQRIKRALRKARRVHLRLLNQISEPMARLTLEEIRKYT